MQPLLVLCFVDLELRLQGCEGKSRFSLFFESVLKQYSHAHMHIETGCGWSYCYFYVYIYIHTDCEETMYSKRWVAAIFTDLFMCKIPLNISG